MKSLKEKTLEKSLNELLETIEETCYEIFIGHPLDLLDLDMNKFYSFCYFLSNHNTKRGELLLIKDKKFKRDLIKFIKEHPDRVFRGKKSEEDENN